MIEIPSFNFALMELLCQQFKERTKNFKVVDCYPNDLSRFFLIFRRKEYQENLFFNFLPPFIRFHLNQSIPRKHSSHPLLSFLKGATLHDASLLQNDRILQLSFVTPHGKSYLIAEFFPKHPNYYLVDEERRILFVLYSLKNSHYCLPPPRHSHSETILWSSHEEVKKGYDELEKEWEFLKEKNNVQSQLAKQLHKLEKRKNELMKRLNESSEWEKVQHEGELIKFHFASIKKGMTSLKVSDWLSDEPYNLILNPKKTVQEEMASRFRQAKKMQKGIAPLTHFLEQTKKEIIQIEDWKQRVTSVQSLQELLLFKKNFPLIKPAQIPSSQPSYPYREFVSASGLKIWVGKNAKANDQLTFLLANGRDWWFHVKGYPGSHVVIRFVKNQEPDPETIKDAMQLALYYSQARRHGEGEIVITQKKYVSKLGKKKGLVQISKHQTVWVRIDPDRFNALQNPNNKKTIFK